jgi:signal transduction histidine kinase
MAPGWGAPVDQILVTLWRLCLSQKTAGLPAGVSVMPILSAIAKLDLPKQLWLALAAIILSLVSLIIVHEYEAGTRTPRLAHNRAIIAHTFEVIATAEDLKSTGQNAERAQRGFLLTGEAGFLDTYRAQANSCLALLAHLRELTVDNAEQQRRMPVIAASLKEWIAERQRTVDAYSQEGFSAAQKLVRSRSHINTMQNLDGLIETVVSSERDLLIQRQEQAARDERRVGEIAFFGGVVDAALLAISVWLTVVAFRTALNRERERREVEQRLGDQLLQAQGALAQAQKMEALGQLTGGVAHDFNNLLHVIKNAVTLVQSRIRSDDVEVNRYLEMAKRNTDRAAGTTSRLLAFSRQQPLDPKPTDINKLVSGMAELLRSLLGETVAMETVLGGGLWPVSIDRNQLETAIINLAVNARDAMPSSGKLTIETSNTFLDESYARLHPGVATGQYSMLAVSDTGVGMTKEIVAKAFDPFFTTKEYGRGTGLGLSQVFGFIKQSGGHVKIYSEPGQGATVKMYFPRLVGSTPERVAEIAPRPSPGSGESILVVEDNEDVRAFTAQVLADLGYRVTLASDGKLAIEILEQLSGVDLLFTDVGLPNGMNGRELAIQAQRRWPRMKVLYTTGYTRNAIIHHGRLDSGVELITKPFTQSSLATKVRLVLKNERNPAASDLS